MLVEIFICKIIIFFLNGLDWKVIKFQLYMLKKKKKCMTIETEINNFYPYFTISIYHSVRPYKNPVSFKIIDHYHVVNHSSRNLLSTIIKPSNNLLSSNKFRSSCIILPIFKHKKKNKKIIIIIIRTQTWNFSLSLSSLKNIYIFFYIILIANNIKEYKKKKKPWKSTKLKGRVLITQETT
jgi:hypothetical protein